MSTVTRRALMAWLVDHGFTELAGKATSHRRFRHESGVVITVPGHGRQNLRQTTAPASRTNREADVGGGAKAIPVLNVRCPRGRRFA